MEHYRILLSQQREALSKDISEIEEQVKAKELELEALKEKKSAGNSALKSIEKKLAKI